MIKNRAFEANKYFLRPEKIGALDFENLCLKK